MNRWIDADALIDAHYDYIYQHSYSIDAVFPTWSLLLMQTAPTIETKEVKYFDEDEKVWKIGRVIVDG